MDIHSIQPRRMADAISLEKLANNQALSQDEKVAEATRQFEAALLRQILAEARKPVFASTFTQKSAVTGIYDDLVTSQLADSISRSGEFGLARCLTTQFQRPGDPAPAASTADPAASASPSPSAPADAHSKARPDPLLSTATQ